MRYITLNLMVASTLLTSCVNRYYSEEEVVQETYVHRYGVEVPPQDWKEQGQHGQVVTMLKNGVEVKKSYSGGVLEGETCYSFPHSSTIEKMESYRNGKLAQSTVYYLSGAPSVQTQFKGDQDEKVLTYWYESGAPKSIENYDSTGLLERAEYYDPRHNKDSWVENHEGVRILRDPYGQIISKDTIQNGMMTLRTTFYPNGAPKEIIPYANGMISGIKKSYLPEGEPNTIEEWVNGKQEGKMILFQNGQKYTEFTVKNQVKNGIERRYRDGDKLVQEINWKDDRRHGEAISYAGSSPKSEWFFKGEPMSKANFDLNANAVIQ